MANLTDAATLTRASSILTIPGYVLDQESLEKIDEISKELVAGVETKCSYELRCAGRTSAGQVFSFVGFDALLSRLADEASRVENLSLRYSRGAVVGLNAVFKADGEIETKAFSDSPALQFDLDRLDRQIRECDQQYSWPVRTFVLQPYTKDIVRFAVGLLFCLLLCTSGYYFYARSVGVNIDPKLIPQGEAIANRAEEAIKSSDTNLKLNVLLAYHLHGFENISDILKHLTTYIAWFSILLTFAIVCALLLSVFTRLYPPAYFRFGGQIKRWSTMERRREVWGIVIVIGFFVNVVAGIVLGFFVR